jgi:hypothetical protein
MLRSHAHKCKTSREKKLEAACVPRGIRASKSGLKCWSAVIAICRFGTRKIVCRRVPSRPLFYSANKHPPATIDKIVAVELHGCDSDR